MYNQNALEQLERLEMAFESTIKKDLFGRLHQVYRKQMFGGGEVHSVREKTEQKLLNSGVVLPINGSSPSLKENRRFWWITLESK